MSNKELEQFIIDNYQRDEQTMILIFAQWCINNELDASELYKRAYPQQDDNSALQEALAITVPREEAYDIDNDTLLTVLSLFDNEELAFVVSDEMSRLAEQACRS